jgi:short-subunit dehydrogenase
MSDAGVAVVTGASAGVGRATARELARRGYDLALLARGEDGLAAAASEAEAEGRRALPVSVDVADPQAVDEAAQRVEDELGPIDVWVNDAMATVFAPFEQVEPEEYRRAVEVTFLGTVWGTRAALRRMRRRDAGAIVQVGSALAYRGIPLQSAYCAAKHAIKGFTESLRCELIHEGSGVQLTMVQLPAHNTPQFDLQRTKLSHQPQPVPPIYQPEVAARAIGWAVEHRRRELFVGAPVMKTVWGNRLFPGFADRYLARNGYKDQQTDEEIDPGRPDNLYAPVAGDHGAHGRFDAEARGRSLSAWALRNPALTAGATLAAAGAALAATWARSR